jgi:SAM-dependent methyltransferase
VLYGDDLAYIQAAGFGDFARRVVPHVISLLRALPPQPRVAIDLGCGAGVSTAALAAAGFDTIAVEPSRPLLELARSAVTAMDGGNAAIEGLGSRQPLVQFVNASAHDYVFPPCAAILALGEPLTYHDPSVDADTRLRDLFGRAARALAPGGFLIFDLIVTGEPTLANRGWTAGADWAVLFETSEDHAAARLHRRIETFREVGGGYRRGAETHEVRVFERDAIVAWLAAAGFDVEATPSYGPVPLPSRRMAFTARRRGA